MVGFLYCGSESFVSEIRLEYCKDQPYSIQTNTELLLKIDFVSDSDFDSAVTITLGYKDHEVSTLLNETLQSRGEVGVPTSASKPFSVSDNRDHYYFEESLRVRL